MKVWSEDECREVKFQWDLRRLEEKRKAQEEHEQRHDEEEKRETDERGRVAPNMWAGDSYSQVESRHEC